MRGALAMAWLAGLGLITWQDVTKHHHPPMPGRLLGASGFFILLAGVAEFGEDWGRVAAALGWGLDLAVLLQLPQLPAALGGPQPGGKAGGKGKQATGTTQAPGSSTAGGRG